MVMASASVGFFGLAGLLLDFWSVGDRLMIAFLGVLMALFLLRYAAIRAEPRAEGIRVRNLFLARSVAWGDILGVRFTEGEAWAHLDLAEGDTLAVMAIQRADGARGRAEAQRLATLVATRQRAG